MLATMVPRWTGELRRPAGRLRWHSSCWPCSCGLLLGCLAAQHSPAAAAPPDLPALAQLVRRIYRRAALVVWPRCRRVRILAENNINGAVRGQLGCWKAGALHRQHCFI